MCSFCRNLLIVFSSLFRLDYAYLSDQKGKIKIKIESNSWTMSSPYVKNCDISHLANYETKLCCLEFE